MQDRLEKATEENVFAVAAQKELKDDIAKLQAENQKYVQELVPLKQKLAAYDKEAASKQAEKDKLTKEKLQIENAKQH